MDGAISLQAVVMSAADPSSKPPRLAEALAKARNSAWLARQPPEFAEQLLSHASLCHYRRGQVITGANEEAPDLHFLLRGAVGIWVPRLTGEIVLTHVLSAPQWFGEIGALSGQNTNMEYHAATACSVLYVPRASVVSLDAAKPEYRQAFLELVGRSMRATMEMAGDFVGHDAEKRVISKLLALSGSPDKVRNPAEGHVLPVSQTDLAFISSVSRPTINAVLAKLEKAGLVKPGYRRIIVLNRPGLVAALRDEL